MVHESLRKMTAHTLQDRLALVTKVFGGRCGEAASSVSAASNDRPSTATAAFRPEQPLAKVSAKGGNMQVNRRSPESRPLRRGSHFLVNQVLVIRVCRSIRIWVADRPGKLINSPEFESYAE